MNDRPRVAWKLAILWGAALVVLLLAALDAFPGKAAATRATPKVSPTASAAVSGTALNPSASARRAAARARASASAAAAGGSGDALLATLNSATLSEDTAVAAAGAIDVTTGRKVAWQSAAFEQNLPAYTASIVKVDIAEAYLLRAADQGKQLDDQAQSLLQTMIENSNNDSAQALYDDLGEDALKSLNLRLGLSGTDLSDNGSWGLTETSVADQLTLLSNLTRSQSRLSEDARNYLISLMQGVESDQSWGVGTVGSDAAIKNGWLPLDDGDGWIINSMGIVTAANGHRIELVVLSNGWDTEAEGVAAVGDLVQNLLRGLGT